MKKVLSLLLVLMLLSAFSLTVFAAGESPFDEDAEVRLDEEAEVQHGGDDSAAHLSENVQTIEESHVPDDAFEGDYAEFTGKDGSKTLVFDNGSVLTAYPDGTVEGVDYKGNQHYEDADDNSTVRFTDGTTAVNYSDGRISYTDNEGKTTTFNTDGTVVETFDNLGFSMYYDDNGHLEGAGFVGSDERIGTDSSGNYLDGKITGPNGAYFEVSKDGAEIRMVTPNGTSAEQTESGYSDSADGRTNALSIKWADGTSYTDAKTTKTIRENGVFVGREITNSGNLTYSDGTKYDYERQFVFDKDGKPVESANNVVQATGADGSTLWGDLNSGALEYHDPNNGDALVIDKNGNLVTLKSANDGLDWNATYDEDGNAVTVDITYGDGATMVKNPDGSYTFTYPDGTEIIDDGNGNVWKNGVQIQKDGEWLEIDESDESPAETEEPTEEPTEEHTEAPTEDAGIGKFMGTWEYDSDITGQTFRATFSQSGDRITIDEGSDEVPIHRECTYSYDPSSGILTIVEVSCNEPLAQWTCDSVRLQLTGSNTMNFTGINVAYGFDSDGNLLRGDQTVVYRRVS